MALVGVLRIVPAAGHMEYIVCTSAGTPVVRVSSEEEATRWAVFIGGQVEEA